MLHYCEYCEYKSNHKWVVTRHTQSKHEIGSIVQQNVIHPPSNIQNQHNSQYGTGENTHYNEDYNNVVGIANEWKKECEIKDNAIRTRDVFLTANNSKLQDEYVKNKILIEQNQNIMEKILCRGYKTHVFC